MLKRKIEDIDLSKIEFTEWVDPRIPSWWEDPAVWRYLGRKYGLKPGGIVYDSDGPPMLVIEIIN